MNMWELLLGKIQATKATEPALDPQAATPVAKEVTGNKQWMINHFPLSVPQTVLSTLTKQSQ